MNTSAFPRSLCAFVLAGAACSASLAGSCDVSPFQVVASIERIVPPDEPVDIRSSDKVQRRAALFDCLLPGDELVLRGRVVDVKLFMNGEEIHVGPGRSPYPIQGSWPQQAAAISHAFSQWWTLRPRETGASQPQPSTKSDEAMLIATDPKLGRAPLQSLLEGTSPLVVGWRANQLAAWAPRLDFSGGGPNAAFSVGESANAFFAIASFDRPLEPAQGGTLSVLDDRGRTVLGVPFSVRSAADLPLPAGFEGDWRGWPPEVRIAWAAWAMREGPPDWHLQALSWLYRYRERAWIAGHLFYRSLNGSLDTP